MTTTTKKYGRLTAREASDLGYIPAKVFVDGQEIQDCVVFDDGEGWADVYDRDLEGNIVLDVAGNVKVKRLYGTIDYYPNSQPLHDKISNAGLLIVFLLLAMCLGQATTLSVGLMQ